MQRLGDHETIAAIGTAKGVGALGIVRLSGKDTLAIVDKCLEGKRPEAAHSHRACFGIWKNPVTGEPVDEVVVLYFAEGRGFTGESSVEVICHGGIQVTELALQAALDGGARLARPGEFSYRAVMNGKLDLARAESILELIHAKSPRAAALALKNLRGALSDRIINIESELVFLLAHLEASIDFTTEDIQPVDFSEMRTRAERVANVIDDLLKSYVKGQVVSRGLRVALAGRPNAGKSSLMNALLGRSRSIVDESPGTTRDTIEAELYVNGQLCRLIDTAGIRLADHAVEKMGIDRALEEVNCADIVLYVIDGSTGLQNSDAEQITRVGSERALIVFNKSDIIASDIKAELTRGIL